MSSLCSSGIYGNIWFEIKMSQPNMRDSNVLISILTQTKVHRFRFFLSPYVSRWFGWVAGIREEYVIYYVVVGGGAISKKCFFFFFLFFGICSMHLRIRYCILYMYNMKFLDNNNDITGFLRPESPCSSIKSDGSKSGAVKLSSSRIIVKDLSGVSYLFLYFLIIAVNVFVLTASIRVLQ